MAGFAEVAVDSPVSGPPPAGTFSYSIPDGMAVGVGHAVLVPFGARKLLGIVFELADAPQVSAVRDIIGVVEPRPALTPHQVALARWLATYYRSPLYAAAALMLPPDLRRRLETVVSLTGAPPDDAALTPIEQQLLEQLRRRGPRRLEQLQAALGKDAAVAVDRLRQAGLVTVDTVLGRPKVRAKRIRYLSLVADRDTCRAALEATPRRASRRAAVLEKLLAADTPLPLAAVIRGGGPVVASLVAEGLVAIVEVEVRRDPLAHRPPPVLPSEGSAPPTPSPAQAAALAELEAAIAREPPDPSDDRTPQVFLLHGVTASGKTELYLRALAATVACGKQGIVLVPEIALTPQTIDRFVARFPGRVGVLHSGLSAGERFDEWRQARDGAYDVVIGPRGAVFAPLERLGLICVDEEHEPTYKQEELAPRYHARDVALKLAELTGAVVVLGSATPTIESYRRAERGEFRLLRLPERVTPGGAALPEVEVVDMREELRRGVSLVGGVFSRSLAQALVAAIGGGEQAILYLNRRGAATFVQCRRCGYVHRCRRCDVALTYHAEGDVLVCHQCNRRRPAPLTCPQCGSPAIRYLGLGTQGVVSAVGALLPSARVLRWDRDSAANRRAHDVIMARFAAHDADVLVGTQMVAKGLDLPQVTVVGVINADLGLYLPDFRAVERSFQLLTQVAGRAGRGERPGKVIFQTYSPNHYAIVAAAQQDYEAFYRKELGDRRQYGNPPFSRLVRLLCQATNADAARRDAERLGRRLAALQAERGLAEIEVVGPAPAYVGRIRGRYRWQIVLRGAAPERLLEELRLSAAWAVDVDPATLL